jgi:hypothetical protein
VGAGGHVYLASPAQISAGRYQVPKPEPESVSGRACGPLLANLASAAIHRGVVGIEGIDLMLDRVALRRHGRRHGGSFLWSVLRPSVASKVAGTLGQGGGLVVSTMAHVDAYSSVESMRVGRSSAVMPGACLK